MLLPMKLKSPKNTQSACAILRSYEVSSAGLHFQWPWRCHGKRLNHTGPMQTSRSLLTRLKKPTKRDACAKVKSPLKIRPARPLAASIRRKISCCLSFCSYFFFSAPIDIPFSFPRSFIPITFSIFARTCWFGMARPAS